MPDLNNILALIGVMLLAGALSNKLSSRFNVPILILFLLLGGLLGFGITLTVVLSIKGLSPTAAISVILVSQLLVAALIDAFGWLGTEKLPFSWHNYAGLALMLGGIVLFKWKKG
jgi:uncharacterized membrane protein YdcZ (DUF606 family)